MIPDAELPFMLDKDGKWLLGFNYLDFQKNNIIAKSCLFSSQLHATCNVNQSLFNDWFTGHLNFQIEHQWVWLVGIIWGT